MAVAALQKFVSNHRNLLVLTGAGISTESGIPDYRSPGRPPYNPMLHKTFVESPEHRKRYWSRSMVGYPRMVSCQPNRGHQALAKAERDGLVSYVITQNVDGLHQMAGSKHVLELHGSIKRVACLSCNKEIPRAELQQMFIQLQPEYADRLLAEASRTLPDGDSGVEGWDTSSFKVPSCPDCGGILKPSLVFFGANLPKDVSQRSTELALNCDALLVVGSSLAVQSAFRLVKIALLHAPYVADKQPAEVFIVNDGPTRADSLLGSGVQKVSARAGEVLSAVFGSAQGWEQAKPVAFPSAQLAMP